MLGCWELAVEGLNGREKAIVDAQKKSRAFTLNHVQARLKGLTIRNGVRGVYFETNAGTVEDAVIESCPGNAHGGGVYLQGSAVLRRTIVRNCTAGTGWGGGAYTKSGSPFIENCLFYGNTASWGANIYVESGSKPTVVNCTFGNGTAGSGHANFYNYSSGGPSVTNTIIYPISSVGATAGHGFKTDVKNLKADPGFTDVPNNDYTLTSSATTAIDQGDDSVVSVEGMKDVNGVSRPVGDHIDIGCYEFNSIELTCAVEASSTLVSEGGEVTLTPVVTGSASPVCDWTLENVAGGPSVTHQTVGTGSVGAWTVTLECAGAYRVWLVATENSQSATGRLERIVYARGTGTFYVATNSVPQYPYATPATAATNLEAGVGMAAAGSVVKVGAGEWIVDDTLALDREIVVEGAGSGLTVIRTRPAAAYRLFRLTSASAVLRGATLTATMGPLFSEGGAAAYVSAGLVEGCRITGCTAANSLNGVGVYLTGANARMSRCIVCDNRNAAYGALYTENYVKVDNVLCYGNTAGWGPELYMAGYAGVMSNCTFVGTIAPESEGGKMVNCVISGTVTEWGSHPFSNGKVTENCLLSQKYGMTDEKFAACSNVLEDIVFQDPVNEDYRVDKHSASRGAGRYAGWMSRAKDLVGNRRAHGGKVDIGAYEYPAIGFTLIVR